MDGADFGRPYMGLESRARMLLVVRSSLSHCRAPTPCTSRRRRKQMGGREARIKQKRDERTSLWRNDLSHRSDRPVCHEPMSGLTRGRGRYCSPDARAPPIRDPPRQHDPHTRATRRLRTRWRVPERSEGNDRGKARDEALTKV